MLQEYYKLRGWSTKTGVPTAKNLQDLGLNFLKEKFVRE